MEFNTIWKYRLTQLLLLLSFVIICNSCQKIDKDPSLRKKDIEKESDIGFLFEKVNGREEELVIIPMGYNFYDEFIELIEKKGILKNRCHGL